MQLPIPDDTNPEFCEYLVCLPKDSQWLAIFRGLLDQISRGRFWDASTGTITDAQAVGRSLRDYNLHLENREVILACTSESQFQDLITELQNIVTELQAIDVNVSQQVTLQSEANAIAISASIAQAFAESTAYLNTSTYVFLDIETPELPENVSETSGPSPASENVKGLKPQAIPKDDVDPAGPGNIACQVADDLVTAMENLINAMIFGLSLTDSTPLHPFYWFGIVQSAVSTVQEQLTESPLLVPRPAMMAVAGILSKLSSIGDLEDTLDRAYQSLTVDHDLWRQELYCIRSQGLDVANGVRSLYPFIDSQAQTHAVAGKEGQLATFLKILFSIQAVAALFYEVVGYTQPATNTASCASCAE